MGEFADKLASLCAREAIASRGNPERYADMVERIAAALGFTIANDCEGDPARIDEMMAGAEAYAHSEAVDKAPLLRLMAMMKGRP